MKKLTVYGVLLIIVLVLAVQTVSAQTTEFSYQGSLKNGDMPANGNYDIQFLLYSSSTGNTFIASTTRFNVPVTNGIFNVVLDFGGDNFNGQDRFLEIAVRPAGSGSYTTLAPRQEVLSAPYAIRSYYSSFANNANILGGIGAEFYVQTNDARLSDARNPLPNSPNYIQNSTTAQTNSNFNISGSGTVGGILSASQFNIGASRLIKTDQWNTLTIGIDSGDVSTNGGSFNNSFVGFRAGKANINGNANSFFGAYSGDQTTSGSKNSFFGAGAGYSNTDGVNNSIFGFDAGRNNLSATATGNRNTIFGSEAGLNMIGDNNTFIGYFSGSWRSLNRTGNFNTTLGSNSCIAANDLEFATVIGAQACASVSNTVQLGREGGTDSVFVPGKLGIGRTAPLAGFHLSGVGVVRARINSESNAGLLLALNEQPKWAIATVSGGNFQIYNDTSPTLGNAFWIDVATNNVGIGTTNPLQTLHVNGLEILSTGPSAGFKFRNRNSTSSSEDWVWYSSNNIARLFFSGSTGDLLTVQSNGVVAINGLGAGGATALCRNASNQISTCSSSIRYKTNVENFRPGLSLIKKLRPITFNWTADNRKDFGLVAEEVAEIEPLLVTTNEKGETEGVKYDRVGVVLINAVGEQQKQIEALEKKIDEQNDVIKKQQAALEALKILVCSQNPAAAICQPKN